MCAVFVLETVQTVLTGADVFYWFASGYGDLNRLTTPFASAIDVPIMESIVSAMVHFFYAHRVWILSNKKQWLLTLISLVGRSQAILTVSYFSPSPSQFSTVNVVAALTIGIHVRVSPIFTSATFWLTVADSSSTSKVRHR